MTKRDKIALAFWYERQPIQQAAVWNTRHAQWPIWLQLGVARYMSWKYMGGAEKWYRKLWHFYIFHFTVFVFKFLK